MWATKFKVSVRTKKFEKINNLYDWSKLGNTETQILCTLQLKTNIGIKYGKFVKASNRTQFYDPFYN